MRTDTIIWDVKMTTKKHDVKKAVALAVDSFLKVNECHIDLILNRIRDRYNSIIMHVNIPHENEERHHVLLFRNNEELVRNITGEIENIIGFYWDEDLDFDGTVYHRFMLDKDSLVIITCEDGHEDEEEKVEFYFAEDVKTWKRKK